jgi:hypothetical protein
MGVVNAIFRDVVDTMDCPLCEAPAGENCNDMSRNPRLLGTAHDQRVKEYVERVGGIEKFRERVARSGPARNGRRMKR